MFKHEAKREISFLSLMTFELSPPIIVFFKIRLPGKFPFYCALLDKDIFISVALKYYIPIIRILFHVYNIEMKVRVNVCCSL